MGVFWAIPPKPKGVGFLAPNPKLYMTTQNDMSSLLEKDEYIKKKESEIIWINEERKKIRNNFPDYVSTKLIDIGDSWANTPSTVDRDTRIAQLEELVVQVRWEWCKEMRLESTLRKNPHASRDEILAICANGAGDGLMEHLKWIIREYEKEISKTKLIDMKEGYKGEDFRFISNDNEGIVKELYGAESWSVIPACMEDKFDSTSSTEDSTEKPVWIYSDDVAICDWYILGDAEDDGR